MRRPEDFYTLNGTAHPGVLDPQEPFRGADQPRMFDKRQGYALDGAWLYYRGLDLSNFSGTFFVSLAPGQDLSTFLAEDADWQAFRKLLDPPPLGRGQQGVPVYDIRHPILQDVGCNQVTVINHMAWRQSGPGIWSKEVRYSVYRKVKPVLNTPFKRASRPVAKTADEKRLQELGDQLSGYAREYQGIGR